MSSLLSSCMGIRFILTKTLFYYRNAFHSWKRKELGICRETLKRVTIKHIPPQSEIYNDHLGKKNYF